MPAGLAGVTAIVASDYHSLALKSDGTVVAWGCGGFTDFGQCSVPAGLSDVVAIAASQAHSLALKSDGTVVAWGCGMSADFGQCTVPSGLSGVTAIAAGDWHSLALVGSNTPASADQCKNDAWKTFVIFRNQGDCVSYVVAHRRPTG